MQITQRRSLYESYYHIHSDLYLRVSNPTHPLTHAYRLISYLEILDRYTQEPLVIYRRHEHTELFHYATNELKFCVLVIILYIILFKHIFVTWLPYILVIQSVALMRFNKYILSLCTPQLLKHGANTMLDDPFVPDLHIDLSNVYCYIGMYMGENKVYNIRFRKNFI